VLLQRALLQARVGEFVAQQSSSRGLTLERSCPDAAHPARETFVTPPTTQG
jgi:hypothetical protein